MSKNNYKIVNHKKFDEWLYSVDFKWQDSCPHKLVLDTGISYEYKSAGRFHVDFIKWNFGMHHPLFFCLAPDLSFLEGDEYFFPDGFLLGVDCGYQLLDPGEVLGWVFRYARGLGPP